MVDIHNSNAEISWECPISNIDRKDIMRTKSLEIVFPSPSCSRDSDTAKLNISVLEPRLSIEKKQLQANPRPLTWGPIKSEDFITRHLVIADSQPVFLKSKYVSVTSCENDSVLNDKTSNARNRAHQSISAKSAISNPEKMETDQVTFPTKGSEKRDEEQEITLELQRYHIMKNVSKTNFSGISRKEVVSFQAVEYGMNNCKYSQSKRVHYLPAPRSDVFKETMNQLEHNIARGDVQLETESFDSLNTSIGYFSPLNNLEFHEVSSCLDDVISIVETEKETLPIKPEIRLNSALPFDDFHIVSSDCVNSILDAIDMQDNIDAEDQVPNEKKCVISKNSTVSVNSGSISVKQLGKCICSNISQTTDGNIITEYAKLSLNVDINNKSTAPQSEHHVLSMTPCTFDLDQSYSTLEPQEMQHIILLTKGENTSSSNKNILRLAAEPKRGILNVDESHHKETNQRNQISSSVEENPESSGIGLYDVNKEALVSTQFQPSYPPRASVQAFVLPPTRVHKCVNDGDVFSKEIDELLERPTMRRQDSFIERESIANAFHCAVEHNSGMIVEEEMMRRLKMEPCDKSNREDEEDTAETKPKVIFTSVDNSASLRNIMDVQILVSKRDSALSRGSEFSTASSDTIIASEEEFTDKNSSRTLPSGDVNVNRRYRQEHIPSAIDVAVTGHSAKPSKKLKKMKKTYVHKLLNEPCLVKPRKKTEEIWINSAQVEESESSPNSSICSSVVTSPTNSPPLHRTQTHHEMILSHENENERFKAELEVAHAVQWLRAAGFPQYASFYEEQQFPVDIQEVGKDHDFLENELFHALSRRLEILNKYSTTKPDKFCSDIRTDDEEDDEDERCAISQNWHYQENIHRWSRLETNPQSLQTVDLSSVKEEGSAHCHIFSNDFDSLSMATISGIKLAADSKDSATKHAEHNGLSNTKVKKTNFFKRELMKFRSSSFRKKDKDHTHSTDMANSAVHNGKKVRAMFISEPQLQTGHEKLEKFRCIPITEASSDSLPSLQHQHFNNSPSSRNRKNSTHSTTSTSSSSAGGGSSATSTPATRVKSNSHRRRLHSMDETSIQVSSPVLVSNQQYISQLAPSSNPQKHEPKVFFIPNTHTPGTFPNMVVDPEFSDKSNQIYSYNTRRSISDNSSHRRPVSIYDNIEIGSNSSASAQDLLDIFYPTCHNRTITKLDDKLSESSQSFLTVDEIVQQTELLKKEIQSWDESEKSLQSELDQHEGDSYECFNCPDVQVEITDTTKHPLADKHPIFPIHQSWVSNEHSPLTNTSSQPLQLYNLSAGQLMILRRLSVLKLTAMMEKYTPGNNTNSGTRAANINWSIPRFIRRAKVVDYKDKSVFGIPLLNNVQRLGQPIPNCILHAMRHLITYSLDQVGLFRKPGVKSRIQKLRDSCECHPDMIIFEDWSAYDIADMVKQYFRDLPDPIMTAKLSETFTGIFLFVPSNLRLEALCAALMMLPDENREALKTLLWFLSNVAACADENQMTESNLAVCFAPSLFYHGNHNGIHNISSKSMQAHSPRARKPNKHTAVALGKPDIKDMNNNKASNQCIMYMIKEFKHLFNIPEDAMTQCRLSVMQQTNDVLRYELGYAAHEGLGRSTPEKMQEILGDFHSYVDKVTSVAVREEIRMGYNKSSGWTQVPSVFGSELSYKKVNDGNHLRIWRCRVEIEGTTPELIMLRILRERQIWDNKLLRVRLVERPDDRSECLHVERVESTPNLNRDYCILRSWRTIQSHKDITVIVEISTVHPDAVQPPSTVRGVVLTSRYVIEASSSTWASDSTSSTSSTGSNGSSQKCYLTHISRVDTKGRNPEWYNKTYGHITLQLLLRLRDTFRVPLTNIHSNIDLSNTGK